MKIIEIQQEDKQEICELLTKANKSLEEAMFKLKESAQESESDTRMWRAEGDYRGMGNYRSNYRNDYRDSEYEDRRYRDDFRYRR